jgi:hypothetical protein
LPGALGFASSIAGGPQESVVEATKGISKETVILFLSIVENDPGAVR